MIIVLHMRRSAWLRIKWMRLRGQLPVVSRYTGRTYIEAAFLIEPPETRSRVSKPSGKPTREG